MHAALSDSLSARSNCSCASAIPPTFRVLRHINQPRPTHRQPAKQTAPKADRAKPAISKLIGCLPNLA